MRRIKLAQAVARMMGTPYYRLSVPTGQVVGNIRDLEFANSLVQGTFRDHGYFKLAGRLVRDGEVHADIGANYGFHTFGIINSAVNPSTKYLLVDANPDCIACLHESSKAYPKSHITICNTAASFEPGEITFTFRPEVTGSGHIGSANQTDAVEIMVRARPLDDLFEEQGIESIGLMKMDIEGSETYAMRGLSRMLAARCIDYIYFEVNPPCLERLQSEPGSLFKEFNRHGYRLFWPHDDTSWIVKSYGDQRAPAGGLVHFCIHGKERHRVVAFDAARYLKGPLGQCDLLAVAPHVVVTG